MRKSTKHNILLYIMKSEPIMNQILNDLREKLTQKKSKYEKKIKMNKKNG